MTKNDNSNQGNSHTIAKNWYQTRQCSDDITLIWEPHVSPDVRCNIWHIRGRNKDLLVDSGMGVVSLRQSVASLSERPLLAVASHTHFDHVGSHHEFEHRLCHPLEQKILAQPNPDNTVWSAFLSEYGEQGIFEALPYADFDLRDYRVNPAPATQLIDEGDELDLGDRLFKVFHMPGHSPGSICLYEAASQTLFAGDVLYDGQLLDQLYHSDPDIYQETLARLQEIPAQTFHCGHYASFGRQRMHEIINTYRAARESR